MVELSQDAGLAEEGAPLLVGAAGAQRLDGHRQLPLAGQLEAAAADLAKVTWGGPRGEKGDRRMRVTIPADRLAAGARFSRDKEKPGGCEGRESWRTAGGVGRRVTQMRRHD